MRVAVTGTGAISPLGNTVQRLCEGMLAGEVGIRRAPWLGPDDPVLFASTPWEFRAEDWADAKLIEGSDFFSLYFLGAVSQALGQAGLADPDNQRDHALPSLRTAVIHGTSMGGMMSLMEAQSRAERLGPTAVGGKLMIKIWCNMAASQVCMRYDLHGPSLTLTTACASSIDAIGTAARLIAAGVVDVAICGGTEGGTDPVAAQSGGGDFVPATLYAGTAYGMASPNTDPRRAMRPFDAHRDGIVSGEGSAALVLESEAHARARGADVLGWVRGYASLADAYHPSSPEPNGRWEALTMEQALADAAMSPADISLLTAHATGTPKGDTAEIRAINNVFADRVESLPVHGLKGNTGHTGASAGAMNALAGLWAMRHGRVPAVAGTTELDPEIRFDVILGEPRSVDVEVQQVNAFGFGGQDSSLVLTRS